MQPSVTIDVPSRYHPNLRVHRYDSTIGRSIQCYGEYQQQEIDLLLSLPQCRHVVYDIGSNIGYHATAFASQCQKLYCFEASPQHVELLKHNLTGVKHSHVINAAITDRLGPTGIASFDPARYSNYGELQIAADQTTRIAATTIDYLVRVGQISPPTLIKIDVEGHEPCVLRGARNTIRQHLPVIYFEAQQSNQMPEIYHFFQNFNYQLFWSIVMNFNQNNFAGSNINHFGSSAIFGVLALPAGEPAPALPPVLDAKDTWEQLLKRI